MNLPTTLTPGVAGPGRDEEEMTFRPCPKPTMGLEVGLHVNVGVSSGDMAIGVTNRLVQYLPHLLAVSANSPFWQGVDTGLKSCRSALYGLLPHAGVPRHFNTWKEFQNFCMIMQE